MCLGDLPLRYGAGLNQVLYPIKWRELYLANEILEYKAMAYMLLDRDWRDLGNQWQKAAEMLWAAGRKGLLMSESLALDALEIWTGCRTYRKMNANMGVDYTQISTEMVQLLGGTRWSCSRGDEAVTGWFEENWNSSKKFMAEFHIRFEHVHPLFEGNGRWGRLLLIYCYGRIQQRPTMIQDRETYLKAVRESDIALLASLL